MERSFARGTRYGFDRARWRRLWRVQIQEYLVASIQNLEILLRHGRDPRRRLALAVRDLGRALSLGRLNPFACILVVVTETRWNLSWDQLLGTNTAKERL